MSLFQGWYTKKDVAQCPAQRSQQPAAVVIKIISMIILDIPDIIP